MKKTVFRKLLFHDHRLFLVYLPFRNEQNTPEPTNRHSAPAEKNRRIIRVPYRYDLGQGNDEKTAAEVNKNSRISSGYCSVVMMIHEQGQTSIATGLKLPTPVGGNGFRARLLNMAILENLEQAPYNVDRTKFMDYVIPIASYNGKIVGFDDSINASGLAYKAALVKQYLGTDEASELEKTLNTWDAFIEKGKEVQQASGGKVYIINSWAAVQEYFNNFGTEPYTKDNKVTDFTLNTRAEERYTLLKKSGGQHL